MNLAKGKDRTPGNTIRKVYLCNAKIKRLRPGDLLFFYMSKDPNYVASQTITTVGVVENVVDATQLEDLMRLTAKRSVFSEDELKEKAPSKKAPVKIINFLLVGHIDPFVKLDKLVEQQIFTRRLPQSIVELTDERYDALRSHVKLGYDL